jgi:hypothetical protein
MRSKMMLIRERELLQHLRSQELQHGSTGTAAKLALEEHSTNYRPAARSHMSRLQFPVRTIGRK